MKRLLLVCLLSIIFAGVYSSQAISPADPDHPGHCYSEQTQEMDYGEEKTIDNCIRVSCNQDGSIIFAGCGAIASPCGKTPLDLTKPYPDCCPQPIEKC